jgi:hypothetical protein
MVQAKATSCLQNLATCPAMLHSCSWHQRSTWLLFLQPCQPHLAHRYSAALALPRQRCGVSGCRVWLARYGVFSS